MSRTQNAAYRIVDEPAPSRWTHIAVDPIWPLFGFMFGGTWLAWPWFVVNGHAVGSPTRWRETALVALGFLGSFGLLFLVFWALAEGYLGRSDAWWALLVVTLWKMGVSYGLFVLQRRTFELYAWFGGRVRNGILVVAAAFFLRDKLLALLPHGIWLLVVF
ncbi:hypothetical protein HHL11_09200 [Ramlibacter sp. G-1-2-2]|uniref:Uncharacterized protein n=1 Tax=Ramlibacter agri TaxID=2728837 RepID=A0A848H029_9BURK|nr:hypothetical protein [Ramlibacter agri]NML43924.1 hypothetical protein [Ramlibacter agri]